MGRIRTARTYGTQGAGGTPLLGIVPEVPPPEESSQKLALMGRKGVQLRQLQTLTGKGSPTIPGKELRAGEGA